MPATEPVENEPTRRPPQLLAWYACGVLAAIGIGIAAAGVHLSGFAPAGLVSIAVGTVLGATIIGLARFSHVDCRKPLVIGTAMLAIVTILTQHAWLYRDFRRQWHEARASSPHVAMFRPATPWSPAEYFRHEATPQQLLLWALDAALITAAAIGTMAAARCSSREPPLGE